MTEELSFDEAASTRPLGGGRYCATVPYSWTASGRTPGGLVSAHLLAASLATLDDHDRPPLSLTTHFLRVPAEGEYEISTDVLRTGRTMVNITTCAVQDEKVIATAHGIFATTRPSPEFDELPMPIVDPPTPGRETQGYIPEFAQPYGSRIVLQERLGPPALSASGGPMERVGWAGFARPRPVDALGLVMMADVGMMPWWSRIGELYATAALDCSIHFRADLRNVRADDLVLIRSRTGLVRDGYLDWDAVMWAPDGTLLCQSRQLLTVLGPAAAG
jgi:acyl-CoA thioesterase